MKLIIKRSLMALVGVFSVVGLIDTARMTFALIKKESSQNISSYKRSYVKMDGIFELEILRTDTDQVEISVLDNNGRWGGVDIDNKTMEIITKYSDGDTEYYVHSASGGSLPSRRIGKNLKTGKLTEEYLVEPKWTVRTEQKASR